MDNGQACAACKLQAGSNGASPSDGFKRCSACKKAWYCGPECQQVDWVRHIFDCDTNQEITTAHHLALAVHDRTLPLDNATLLEYGFTRAPTAHAKSQLLGLYVDLVEQHRVTAKKIHRWASEDDLLVNIQATFARLPAESRGPHYPWLLENIYVLDTSIPEPEPERAVPASSNTHRTRERRCKQCGSIEGDMCDDGEWYDHDTPRFESYKQCSGCKRAWYCSPSCQKRNWVRHIFECKPRQPINTSHYLALAVADNLIPEDPQTCDDYGFTKAFTTEASSNLLGVYIGLIEVLNISPKKIHQWRIEGRLLPEIKAAFEKLPPRTRGDPRGNPMIDMINRAFKYANMPLLSPNDSIEEYPRRASELSPTQARCLGFAAKLLSRGHPAPHDAPDYVTFGFCACTCPEEESELGGRWQLVLKKCTFEELCQAYDSGSLLSLFHKAGVPISTPAIVNVLETSPHMNYSVWDLKQFVLGTDDSKLQPIPPVRADYGFMNCLTNTEKLHLKTIYKSMFMNTNMDPIQLHQACISGKLFDFVGQYYALKQKKRAKYIRLLRNVYPLPDL